MRAMILAAGLGTRLRPVTDTIPKPLLPVVGVPNIVLTISRLRKAGIREIVINTHWLKERLKSHLGDGSRYGVAIAYSDEEKALLGTGGGIRNALPLLGDDDFIVVNGDALFAPDLEAAVSFHHQKKAHATLIVRSDPKAEQYGAVGFDTAGRVRKLVYGGRHHADLTYDMFTGVHIISKQVCERLPSNGCIVRNTYIPMVEEGAPIFALEMDGYFCDLGTVGRYLSANSALITQEESIPDIPIPSNGIFIGADCRIDSRATLSLGTIICDHVVIEGAVHIERSIILENGRVNQSISNAVVTSEGVIVPG